MLHTRDLVIRKQPHWLRLAVVLCSVLLMNPYATPAEPEASRENEESDRPTTTEEGEKTGKTERPSLGRLLELNGAAIFGGSVKAKGEALEITFNQTGQMQWCETEIAKLRKSAKLIEKSAEEGAFPIEDRGEDEATEDVRDSLAVASSGEDVRLHRGPPDS